MTQEENRREWRRAPLHSPIGVVPSFRQRVVLLDCCLGNLLRKRHSLPILLALYERGQTSTTGLILCTSGHPAAVIGTLRLLESLGLVTRTRQITGRHTIQADLTPLGQQLVETPPCLWDKIALGLEKRPRVWGSQPIRQAKG